MLSSHGRKIGTQDALKKESRGLSQVAAGNPGFPRLVPAQSLRQYGTSTKTEIEINGTK